MESPKPPTNSLEHETSRTLGRYQIQEELGRGAMGAVYKAFDPVISRTVALKTILIDDRAPDRAQMIERLKQEAKAAGGLDHPNIITIYDVGEENGAVYLSMQYVKGTTLANLLAESGVPSLPTFISWADQISGAVGFAHARGVIHRDLKPANIMVTEQGAIKVLDFGIAKIENASLTQTGLVIGTPGYMSPEQIAGRKVDHRSDIFSLGAVFYELVTREKPFDGDIATILYKIVNEDPVAPSIINPAVPGAIDAVIRKALAKDPKDRFQTCEEMRQALLAQSAPPTLAKPASAAAGDAVANRPVPARNRRVSQPAPQLGEAPQRIWPRLLLTSALVLVAAAGWAFYVHSRTGAFPPVLAKLDSKIKPAQSLVTGTLNRYSTQAPHRADDHSVTSASPQNPQTANAVATGSQPAATQSPAAQASTTQASTTSAISATAPTLQPVAAQSSSDQPVSTRPASDSASVSSTPALSPATQTSRPADPSQSSTQDADSNERNEPGNSTARHPLNSPFAPRANEPNENAKPNASPATPKPPARKRAPEPPLTVDGFTRQDVPDLLRQADSSATRGDYRLARYEYELVLKLDRSNVPAREGLRRLLASWQSR